MYTPWTDLELFLAVAEAGSFSAAARSLQLTQPTVSRRVAALEEHFGRPLFRRDVEGAHLTPEAERLLPAAQQMARWAGELGRFASGWEDKPEGRVRIATPPGFAYDFLVPFAAEFKKAAPGVTLELLAGIEHLDLSRGQAELAVRIKKPTQPDLEAVLGLRTELGVFVARDYAARLRERLGARPDRVDVNDIDWVGWAPPYEYLEPTPTLKRMIPGFAPAFASNDYIVQLKAAALGLGAMILPRAVHRYTEEPQLVEVPVGLKLPPFELYVVCAKTMRWVPRVQRVLQGLRTVLGQMQGAELVEAER